MSAVAAHNWRPARAAPALSPRPCRPAAAPPAMVAVVAGELADPREPAGRQGVKARALSGAAAGARDRRKNAASARASASRRARRCQLGALAQEGASARPQEAETAAARAVEALGARGVPRHERAAAVASGAPFERHVARSLRASDPTRSIERTLSRAPAEMAAGACARGAPNRQRQMRLMPTGTRGKAFRAPQPAAVSARTRLHVHTPGIHGPSTSRA